MTIPRVSATMLSVNNASKGDVGMLGMISREARRLGIGEKRRLTGLLRTQVPDGLGKAGGESDACPRCGGTHLVRRRSRARHIGPRGVRGLRGATSATSSARSRTGAGRPTRRTASALGAVGEGTPVSTDGLRGYARVLPALACRATTRRPRGRPCAASSAWRTLCTRGPRASWRASGGSRRGGPATTPAGSCGTSRRGGRTPTGRTPCRARRRRGATTTRGSPSRGSRSPSGPTGRISWPCRRWSNRELANLCTLLCLHVCLQRCSSVHECPKTAPRGHFSQSVCTPLPPRPLARPGEATGPTTSMAPWPP